MTGGTGISYGRGWGSFTQGCKVRNYCVTAARDY
jgi:hypothetical protein